MAEADSRPYGLIYRVTNRVTGRVYIGQTIMTLKERWKGHRGAGKSSRLWLSIQAHGREAFDIEQIDFAHCKRDLDELEIKYIEMYRSTDPAYGYNFERGGSGQPKSKESVAAGAEKLRGRSLTDEHKKNISIAKAGVKQTREQIEKMRAAKIGYKHTAEARQRMSLASIGKRMPPVSAAHREKLAAAARAVWAERKRTAATT